MKNTSFILHSSTLLVLKLRGTQDKSQMKSVKTVHQVLESQLGTPLELLVTIPQDPTAKKIPITIVLGIQSKSSQLSTLCCYHYCIPNRNGNEIFGTALLDTNNDWILDVTRQAATAVSKKFHRPCYVAWSAPQDHQYNSVEQTYVVKQCLDYIKNL